ncbi:MAG: hypothetical protein LBQ68_04390 [Clostridiales bacterium]|jgi:hypothetical protein|nr:hypothetical protein [Clostridiales bacterium]
MLAILLLALSLALGYIFIRKCFPYIFRPSAYTFFSPRDESPLFPAVFVIFPGAFSCGLMLTGWSLYIFSYLFRDSDDPLKIGCIITFAVLVLVVGIYKAAGRFKFAGLRVIWADFIRSLIEQPAVYFFFALVGAFITWLMTYTFFQTDGVYNMGYSIFSDFSVHTALIRSFSLGSNFPTEFPHFPDGTIRYHFMFQFCVGVLEYLGMPMDKGMNLLSIIVLINALLLLYVLAVSITGKKLVGMITIIFFLFRSSMTGPRYMLENAHSISQFFKIIYKNPAFIGYTPNENWGLWNMNVYANQRHFALGISVVIFGLLVMMPLFIEIKKKLRKKSRETVSVKSNISNKAIILEDTEPLPRLSVEPVSSVESNIPPDVSEETANSLNELSAFKNLDSLDSLDSSGSRKPQKIRIKQNKSGISFKRLFFEKSSWLPAKIIRPIALGILIGAMAYFHGSAVIALLSMLAVLGLFSKHKLEYLIIAVIAYGLSRAETMFFAPGIALAQPAYVFGFIAEEKSAIGVRNYLFALTGIVLIVAALGVILKLKKFAVFGLMFITPLILTFTLSLTPDVTVNHKFLMISIALVNIFAAYVVCQLLTIKLYGFRGRMAFSIIGKLVAIVIVAFMTITGIIDIFTIKNLDGPNRSAIVQDQSAYSKWLKQNTKPEEIFFSYWDGVDEIYFAGRKEFYGWPYYAWSGGYDTNGREEIFNEIVTTQDEERLRELINDNKLSYIVVDPEFLINGNYVVMNLELMEKVSTVVYADTERELRVLKTEYTP